jgi:large subunit ribosomal protein L4
MTLSLTIQNPADAKSKGGKVDLPAEVFDVPTNVALLHQVVVAQLAAARQGTHATKTRGEVRGGGKKPFRQKGTGRARQGSTRAPQFTGGGVVHGPQPRSYDQRTPKKMKAAALRGALSDRARNGKVIVVSALVSGQTPSTRAAAATLAKVSTAGNVLVVASRTDEITWLSLRNVPAVHLLEPGQLNTYDVLVSDDVVFTQGALNEFLGQPAPVADSAADDASDDDAAEAEAAPAKKVAAKKAAATKAPATKAPATKAPAKKAEAAATAPATKAAATKAAAKKAPAKAAAKKAAPKKAAPKVADESPDVADAAADEVEG